MKLLYVILIASLFAACSSSTSSAPAVNLSSVRNYISDAWHLIDSSAVIDSVVVTKLDTITQKQRLTESSYYWIEKLQQMDDSISSAEMVINTQADLMAVSDKYKIDLGDTRAQMAGYRQAKENLISRKQWMQRHWDSIRMAIPLAVSKKPEGYAATCSYIVKSNGETKKISAVVILDSNFTAIDRDDFYNQ
jgi:hypothetical protein